jgi:hypothetical protein
VTRREPSALTEWHTRQLLSLPATSTGLVAPCLMASVAPPNFAPPIVQQ